MGIRSLLILEGLLVLLVILSRRNPLFLCGAGAFLVFGNSMFVDLNPGPIFSLSSLAFTGSDLVFVAFVLGWLYALRCRAAPRARISTMWVALSAILAAFLALELALAALNAGGIHPAFVLGTREWFYIPVGFLLTLDILRRFSMGEIREYLGVLSIMSTGLMVLYIASALGLPVYPYESYQTVFGGVTIVRGYSTAPQWAPLAWCYYLSLPQRKGWVNACLAVLAVGVLLSFTRSAIFWTAIVAVLVPALLVFRSGRRTQGIAVGLVFVAIAIAVLVVGPVVAPQQSAYLETRFQGTQGQYASAYLRLADFERAQAAGAQVDRNLGAGLHDASASVYGAQYRTPDSDWIGIVYRTGWVGIVMFSVPLGVGIWRGLRGIFSSELSGPALTVLLAGLLATVWFTGMRLTSTMYLYWPAVSLLPIALVARAEARPVSRDATVDLDYGSIANHRVSERASSS